MAKTIDELETEIASVEEKIKKLSAKRSALRVKIDEIKNREVLELARQIKSAGKIEEVRQLISEKSEGTSSLRSAG